MKLSDFQYELPERLIAQQPLDRRDESRMMLLDPAHPENRHHKFMNLPGLLTGDEVIVYNDTKVFPARIHAIKPTGGAVELLILRVLEPGLCEAMTRSSKPIRPGLVLTIAGTDGKVVVREVPSAGRAVVSVDGGGSVLDLADRFGSTPLPPYIRRPMGWDDREDRLRYQTVYARESGSVAAPTAGLHFTPAIMQAAREKGCLLAPITLHVGPGTFQPVRVEDIERHRMETEFFHVTPQAADLVNQAKAESRPVLAVGTTSVRCLETAGSSGLVQPGSSSSDLFIRPGYQFNIVEQLITNFHLPGSSLIMLVSALAGRDNVMAAYRQAVELEYRFYSYGDCMLIRP